MPMKSLCWSRGGSRSGGVIAELLAQKGLYASMWDRQREASEAQERLRKAVQDDKGYLPSHDHDLELAE